MPDFVSASALVANFYLLLPWSVLCVLPVYGVVAFREISALPSALTRAQAATLWAVVVAQVQWLQISMAIDFDHYRAHGHSEARAFQFQGLMCASHMLMEVPSGYFADRVGRKRTLLLAGGAHVAAFALRRWTVSYWGLALSTAMQGVFFAMYSGSLEALVVETFRGVPFASAALREEAMLRYQGTLRLLESLGFVSGGAFVAAASAAGALDVGDAFPVYGAMTLVTSCGFAVYLLAEDTGSGEQSGKRPPAPRLRLPRKAMHLLVDQSALFGLFFFFVHHGVKPAWTRAGFPVTAWVCFYTVSDLVHGMSARLAGVLPASLQPPRCMGAPLLLYLGALAALGGAGDALVSSAGASSVLCVAVSCMQLVFMVVHGAVDNCLSVAINALLEDGHRATLISVAFIVGEAINLISNASAQVALSFAPRFWLPAVCLVVFVTHRSLSAAISAGMLARWETGCKT